MKFINRAFVMALLVMPQAVWAVTPANIGTMPLTNTSATIERGGTITAVNRRERTITSGWRNLLTCKRSGRRFTEEYAGYIQYSQKRLRRTGNNQGDTTDHTTRQVMLQKSFPVCLTWDVAYLTMGFNTP